MLKVLLAAWSTVVFAAGADITITGVVHAGGRPYEHAVVWLDTPATPPQQGRRPVMDQRNLQFAPRVLAVRAGTTVDFPNNDRVFHNVFSFKDGKRFDLGLYPVGASKPVTFDKTGVSRIYCNIHPQMAAYVVAVDSPYFAVSRKDGSFTLPDVPAGRYTFHAWRAGVATVTGTYETAAGRQLEIRWP